MQIALDLGTPVSGIAEAVFARSLSGHAEQRDAARGTLAGPADKATADNPDEFIDDVRRALYASKVVAYAQGFDMIRSGAEVVRLGHRPRCHGHDLARRLHHPGEVPGPDPGGLREDPELPSLLVDPYFAQTVADGQESWRRVVAMAAAAGVPVPGFGAALAYYDGLRRERLPAALVQGLRDLFGAHTYRRVDAEGTFHLDWSGDKSEREA